MQYVFFWGGGGVRDVSTCGTLLLRLPHLFLDFLSSINPVSTPFGREGGGGIQGCPNLPYFAFPASASLSWLPQSH